MRVSIEQKQARYQKAIKLLLAGETNSMISFTTKIGSNQISKLRQKMQVKSKKDKIWN